MRETLQIHRFTWLLCLSVCLFGDPAKAQPAPFVILEVNETAAQSDDFFCWSPVPARARLSAPAAAPLRVRILGVGPATAGAVWFQADTDARPTKVNYVPKKEIEMTLPPDGSWRRFWVSGQRASVADKDAKIQAQDATTGKVLGELLVMVRVRKNADELTPAEINQFLSALAKLNGTLNGGQAGLDYVKHAIAHDQAFRSGIHRGDLGFPLFLAWHRALLLGIERELQSLDPRVALPYWRFDRPSSKIFTPDFMGTTTSELSQPGGFLVDFAATNPLRNWRMPVGGGLVRAADVANAASVSNFGSLMGLPGNDQYDAPGPRGINGEMERRYHNDAHADVGGWLGSRSSPRDPLFYLLHANVDRAWAEWQAHFDRFDATDAAAYSAQGKYPGPPDPNRFRQGSYAEDPMWPWSQNTGQSTADPHDDWHSTVYPFPAGPAGAGPPLPPTPASMIDYMNVTGEGATHFACYDHIDFFGNIN